MYVERIPNRSSPPAILLRESYRNGDKIKKRTLANLSDWPTARIEALRRVLRDGGGGADGSASSESPAQLPHVTLRRRWAHCASSGSTGCCRKAVGNRRARWRCCIAMAVARLIDSASKLATARGLR